jgi:hypothetical protein
MEFKLVGDEKLRTTLITKASATVIPAGALVALNTGLAIKAVAGSAAVAWTPAGAGDGETVVEVTVGNDFILAGTGENNFAVAQKAYQTDIIGTTTVLINNDAAVTKVLQIDISKDAGTVGSKDDIRVRINKPLY